VAGHVPLHHGDRAADPRRRGSCSSQPPDGTGQGRDRSSSSSRHPGRSANAAPHRSSSPAAPSTRRRDQPGALRFRLTCCCVGAGISRSSETCVVCAGCEADAVLAKQTRIRRRAGLQRRVDRDRGAPSRAKRDRGVDGRDCPRTTKAGQLRTCGGLTPHREPDAPRSVSCNPSTWLSDAPADSAAIRLRAALELDLRRHGLAVLDPGEACDEGNLRSSGRRLGLGP
jgi:hypothetical protein